MRPANEASHRLLARGCSLAAIALILAALTLLLLPSRPPPRAFAQAPAPCAVRVSSGQSVQAAISSAPSGAVICLDAGVYFETARFDHTTAPGLTLRGAGTDATVLDGLGQRDAVLILNASGITIEHLGLRNGMPASAYLFNARDARFRNVAVSLGGIGIHIDAGSTAEIRDSQISDATRDGILLRRGSSAAIIESNIRGNGGAGVSAVGNIGRVLLSGSHLAANQGPGFFAGRTPCQLLPPASVEAPACFLANPGAFIASGDYSLDANTIEDNGSTGVVFFPGTKGLLTHNRISGNRLTGLFVWGARVSALLNRFERNEEHAAEYRAYPMPILPGHPQGTFVLRAGGSFLGNVVQDTKRLEGTVLGGGFLSQGATLAVQNNLFVRNAGIGVSFVNGAEGEIAFNRILENGGSAICIWRAGAVRVSGNATGGNLSDRIGVCAERPP